MMTITKLNFHNLSKKKKNVFTEIILNIFLGHYMKVYLIIDHFLRNLFVIIDYDQWYSNDLITKISIYTLSKHCCFVVQHVGCLLNFFIKYGIYSYIRIICYYYSFYNYNTIIMRYLIYNHTSLHLFLTFQMNHKFYIQISV